jgi:hypothetical protein
MLIQKFTTFMIISKIVKTAKFLRIFVDNVIRVFFCNFQLFRNQRKTLCFLIPWLNEGF